MYIFHIYLIQKYIHQKIFFHHLPYDVPKITCILRTPIYVYLIQLHILSSFNHLTVLKTHLHSHKMLLSLISLIPMTFQNVLGFSLFLYLPQLILLLFF